MFLFVWGVLFIKIDSVRGKLIPIIRICRVENVVIILSKIFKSLTNL